MIYRVYEVFVAVAAPVLTVLLVLALASESRGSATALDDGERPLSWRTTRLWLFWFASMVALFDVDFFDGMLLVKWGSFVVAPALVTGLFIWLRQRAHAGRADRGRALIDARPSDLGTASR